MSKFVVVIFPNEAGAYEGTRALNGLHADGSLTLYGMAVVAKDAKGNFTVKETADAGPLGTAVGTLLGGLLGVIGGPVGMVTGAAGGVLLGSLIDVVNYGVGEDFMMKVSNELVPGKAAIVAEIAETWTTPLDARVEALGGTVLRTWRADFEDELIAKDVAAQDADFEQLQAEFAQANAETKAKLSTKLDQAKTGLKQADARLQGRIDALNKEMDAKVATMEKQVAEAQADAKEIIRHRIAAMRADYEARSAKLKQAWALTKEALAA
ncbi:DUF1269 domain-containing protein [Mesorhizobium sangaii]|uniref:Putative membrane protein n=1 Tax=Mesorhizobium sangaii TaxID=505389 RepID=A0A841PGA3_9HYPH|nr:DUF1269 domain-containing protein [Mesorhizobium sangaii]MBB6409222.1 putative membrane protein [Mesorhizobium sangaii]